jgi:hypothetical protein
VHGATTPEVGITTGMIFGDAVYLTAPNVNVAKSNGNISKNIKCNITIAFITKIRHTILAISAFVSRDRQIS